MRKICALLLCLCLLPACAAAERLTITIRDDFRCDAEVPDVPDSLPIITCEPMRMDKDLAISLLMPDAAPIEEVNDGDFRVGDGSGDGEFMMVQSKDGRVYYTSKFVSMYMGNLIPEWNGEGNARYYPTDLELDFMTRDEAIGKALDLMHTLGVEITGEPRVYTMEREHFARMQDAMRASEWLGHIRRMYALRYLEPLPEEHEGYFVLMTPTVDGKFYAPWENRFTAYVLITRQGVEFLETGFNLRKTGEQPPKPLIPVEEALQIASEGNLYLPLGVDCLIERISIIYLYSDEHRTLTPHWLFDYCSGGPGGMEKQDFDHPVRMHGVAVNAHTGKLVQQCIY